MRFILCAVVMCVIVPFTRADVVGWRTDGTGSYPQAEPVTKWGADQNILWKTKLPAAGNATPVVVGDRIFVCAEPTTLICVNAADGRILWQAEHDYADVLSDAQKQQLQQSSAEARQKAEADLQRIDHQIDQLKAAGDADRKQLRRLTNRRTKLQRDLRKLDPFARPKTHGANGYASPTPVSDGKHVFVLFGTGVAAAYTLDGERLWAAFIGKPKQGWGHSASPLLAGGNLVIHLNGLKALDPNTGAIRWTLDSRDGYGSPVATRIGDTDVILTTSGDAVRASDGEMLASGLGRLTYAAPVVHDGVVYYIERKSATAVQLPDTADKPFKPQTLWNLPNKIEGDRHYASPVIHDGLIYAISRREEFTILDAATGEIIYEKKNLLGGKSGTNSAYPSLCVAGSRIFVSNEKGKTAVLTPGRKPEILRINDLDEGFRASPVFVGDRIYIRGFRHLYCIGQNN